MITCDEHHLVLRCVRVGEGALGLQGEGGVLGDDGALFTPFVSDSDDLLDVCWGVHNLILLLLPISWGCLLS